MQPFYEMFVFANEHVLSCCLEPIIWTFLPLRIYTLVSKPQLRTQKRGN